MRRHGINYDTGFVPTGEFPSRPEWDPDVVRRELEIIAHDLRCDAVRISGADPERLTLAAGHAAAAGLEVWFSPFPCNMTTEELLPYLAECAQRADALHGGGAEVVFVAGCELSLFNRGFLPGDDLFARLDTLVSADEAWYRTEYGPMLARLNRFLREAAALVRTQFRGRLTYAAGPWERVDWTPFDIVGADAYRADYNAGTFRDEVRGLLAHGKPVAATEFGCCTYRGAAARGGAGWLIVDREAKPPRLDGDYVRDEAEQAGYLTELLAVFEEEELDAAFWFTFAGYGLTHRPDDPRHDLDLASYGLVAMLPDGETGSTYPDMPWEPKESFHAMAAAYAAAG